MVKDENPNMTMPHEIVVIPKTVSFILGRRTLTLQYMQFYISTTQTPTLAGWWGLQLWRQPCLQLPICLGRYFLASDKPWLACCPCLASPEPVGLKAGAHMGKVTIAEVGVRKRSIAFHGDTVNTTSRIHDQCNNYGQRLLVSKELLSRLADPGKLRYVYIGDEILKGKHHHMEIYGIKGLAQGLADPQALVAQSY